MANNSREMLDQSEHALERIDDGTYGICESCGNPIGKLRLQAVPRATLCRSCKTEAGAPLIPLPRRRVTDAVLPVPDLDPRHRASHALFAVLVGRRCRRATSLTSWPRRGRCDPDPGGAAPPVRVADQLNLIRNPGAAFSIGTGCTWVLTLVACGVLGVHRGHRPPHSAAQPGRGLSGCCSAGALGNLTDRMVRAPGPGRGHVVDFLDYFGWFIGNLADIAIVGAAVLIAVLAMRGIGVDGRRARARQARGPRREATRREATRHEATRHEAEPHG